MFLVRVRISIPTYTKHKTCSARSEYASSKDHMFGHHCGHSFLPGRNHRYIHTYIFLHLHHYGRVHANTTYVSTPVCLSARTKAETFCHRWHTVDEGFSQWRTRLFETGLVDRVLAKGVAQLRARGSRLVSVMQGG